MSLYSCLEGVDSVSLYCRLRTERVRQVKVAATSDGNSLYGVTPRILCDPSPSIFFFFFFLFVSLFCLFLFFLSLCFFLPSVQSNPSLAVRVGIATFLARYPGRERGVRGLPSGEESHIFWIGGV